MLRAEGFAPYAKRAEAFFIKGNILDGTKVLLAIYEGHNNIYEPGYEEEEIFDGCYNDTCHDMFLESFRNSLSFFKTLKNEAVIFQILDVIAERVQFWKEKYDKSLYEDEFKDRNVVYDLKVFEPFLLILLKNRRVAIYMEKLLLNQGLKIKN